MKKVVLTVMAASALCSLAWADFTPQQWRSSESLRVRAPFMNDTVNNSGGKYRPTELLNSKVNPELTAGGTVVTADTAGVITLSAPTAADGGSLQVLQTQMRAERFARGTLKVTSPVAFKVLLNGSDIITKESVQDSITGESTASAQLRLEPEHDVTLTVKVLTMAGDSVTPTVQVTFVPDEKFKDVTVVSGPDMKRRFALDDTQYGNRVSNVSVSPDGKYLITTYSNYYSADRSRSWSTLTDLQSGKVLNQNLPWGVRWMPKGNDLYYTATAAEGFDLYRVNPISGKQELMASSIPTDRFTWSPNEDYILYTDFEEGTKEQGPLRRYDSPDDRMPGNRGRWFISKYTPATGLSERITFGNHSTMLQDVSADGKKILCMTMQENPIRRPFYDATFYELDLSTLKADTLATGQNFVNSALYSPDGKKILFMGSPSAFDEIGKNCGDHPIANDYDHQGFILDRATGKINAFTRNFNPSIESFQCWNRADGRIYMKVEEGFYLPLYAYDPATDKFEKLAIDVDVVSGVSVPSESATRLAYFGQGYEYNSKCYVYDIKHRRNTLVADPRAEELGRVNLSKVEPWTFTASDGTEIDGVICYPPDFDASKKYPLIVYYYGGTSPTIRSISQPYTPQLFASRDYVVYVINPSGTTGYGQEFSARHVNAWGKQTANDIIEGVKKFTAAHPFVDADKIGCLGASYGGFMTQYLQTQTDIFAAAVSHAGISNVTSYWGEGYWGYSYNAVAAADSYPWSDPKLFTEQGSLFNADKINTPLLLLHGTADTNVPIGESIQLFNALRILGKEVEFISVDGENHFISDYPKRILWQNSIMAWFERWLHDDPSWWNDLYPERTL
jgi:dipeptidyl aminopeptidase/acylaminoacyl peptidase